MKIFVVFDASASSYEVSGEASGLKGISGVNSVETMERAAGDVPRYCMAIDIDDATAEDTGAKLKAELAKYSEYMSNLAWGAYKKI